MTWKTAIVAAASVLAAAAIAGCGASKTKPPALDRSLSLVTVHVQNPGSLSSLPFETAQKLGFFAQEKLSVQLVDRSAADIQVSRAGRDWPVIGYLSTGPDLFLLSPVPDPSFRLRALNHLPLVAQQSLARDEPLVAKILAAHHAEISRFSVLPARRIERLWQHHHLPWVLVNLSESVVLRRINPNTQILSWLGASTGPVPFVVVSAREHAGTRLSRLLVGLNLALWYLNTTPPSVAAAQISGRPGDSRLIEILHEARRYHFWPATTFPDEAAFLRRRNVFNPNWPAYLDAVNPNPARQALADSGTK